MKIALSGYGKMGKVIEKLAMERGHTISARIHSGNTEVWNDLNPENTDVVIEFSTPETVVENIRRCYNHNLPVVVGTTGWGEHLDDLSNQAVQSHRALLHASNFSIGVNLFFQLNKYLAKLMNKHTDYLPVVDETHHIHKKDAPSGTAISLAKDLIANDNRFSGWVLDHAETGKLQVNAHREDEVPGTHVITYSSNIDALSIRHEAKSREGFALGSIVAAEWLIGKKGVFTMKDVLSLN